MSSEKTASSSVESTVDETERRAFVYIALPGDGYVPAGILAYLPGPRRYRFVYGNLYRQRPNAIPLDPVRLPLTIEDEVVFRRDEGLPNAFRDAAPDSWGRKVLSVYAPRPIATLGEFAILTAAHDPLRVGALAFGPDLSGPRSMAPWLESLPISHKVDDLGRMAHLVRLIDQYTKSDNLKALRDELHDPILKAMAFSLTSLVGGSRPKAFYQDGDGVEWIAKFPQTNDPWNDPRIEYATMNLARKCGVNIAEIKLEEVDEGVDVLLVRRFDRDDQGTPRHIISGFTLADLPENGDWDSYQHLAEATRKYADPLAGHELFKRMVFNVLCSNRDDHPKQQAFFVSRTGVQLTPAYDITPAMIRDNDDCYNLAMRCGRFGRQATLENILSWPEPFGLRKEEAREIVSQMLESARCFRDVFADYGVSATDIEEVSSRFIWAGCQMPSCTKDSLGRFGEGQAPTGPEQGGVKMEKWQGAIIQEQQVKFAVMLVKRSVMDSRIEKEKALKILAVKMGLPVVLAAKRPDGGLDYWGRKDLTAFLSNYPPESLPWREITIN